tara:strand:+ start:2834 stop:5881 length:3048 start_codon:yes stop_codon:yes gene_type:complete
MAEFRGKLKAPAAIISAGINKLKEIGRTAEVEIYAKDLSDKPEVVTGKSGGKSIVLPEASDKDIESLMEVFTENGYKGPGLNLGRLGDIFDSKEINIDPLVLYKGLKKMGKDVDDPSSYDFLNQLRAQNVELFEFARRGKLSIEDMTKMANKIGLYEISQKMLMRKPGEMLSPEEVLGGLLMAKRLSDETKYGAASILQRKADGTISPEQFAEEYRKHQKLTVITENLLANVAGSMSEAGRTLAVGSHAEKIIDTDTRLGIGGNYGPSMDMPSVSATNQILSELEEKEALYDLMVVASLPKKQTPSYISNTAKYGRKAIDFMMEAYINALLSSPVTHMVNMSGNSAFQLARLAETGVAGVIGNIRRGFGAGDDRAMLIETQAFLHGSLMAQKDALSLMARTMIAGESSDLMSKLDIRELTIGDSRNIAHIMEQYSQGNWMPAFLNTVGVANSLSGRFLAAEDELFKVMIRKRVRYQEAYRAQHIEYEKRLSAGFSQKEAEDYASAMYTKYLSDPPPEVLIREKETALKETFQSPIKAEGPVMGRIASGGNALFNNHVAKVLGVPFFKTPTNIFLEVADRSINIYPTMKALTNGKGREFDEAVSKLVTGWGIMGTVIALTSGYYGDDIIITGTGPGNKKARAIINKGANVPSTSIGFKQDDGTYEFTSFNRFDPLSMLLVAAADYNNFVEYNGDADVSEKLLNSLLMVATEYSSNMPFMQGVAELVEVVGNKYDDTDNWGENVLRYFGRKGGSFTMSVGGKMDENLDLISLGLKPLFVDDYVFVGSTSFSATMERMSDPNKSNTMLTDDQINSMRIEQINPFWRGWLEALNQARARHPLFAQGTYDDVNFWNEPIMQMDPEQLRRNGKLIQSFNPMRVQTGAYTDVDLELLRLSQLGYGTFNYHPRKVDGYALTSEEYLNYVNAVNNSDADGRMPGDDFYDVDMTLRNRLHTTISDTTSPEFMEYMSMSDEDKFDHLNLIILGDHRKAAKSHIMTEGRLDRLYRIDNPESDGYSIN